MGSGYTGRDRRKARRGAPRTAGNLAPLVAVLVWVLLLVLDPVPLQALRNLTFDQYQRWQPRHYQDTPVRVIDIDDESLRRLGQWPWHRSTVADLVARLQDAGAAAIALDVLFAEPDRLSPANDHRLAQVMTGGRVVLGQSTTDHAAAGGAPQVHARFVTVGPAPLPFLPTFPAAVTVLPELAQAAAGVGAITFIADADGVVRRVPLVLNVAGALVPSLAAETLRVAQGARNVVVTTEAQAGAGLAAVRIGGVSVPTTPSGESWVHYSGPGAARTIPAWKVLTDAVPAEALRDTLILVGTSAKGLHDVRFTPLGEPLPGVEVHAQWLEQALSGQWLQRPAWARGAEALLVVVGGLCAGYVALLLGAAWSLATLAALLAVAGGGTWYSFVQWGMLLDALAPALAVLSAYGAGSVVRMREVEKRQRWIREAFSRYFSPNLVAYLVKNPQALRLGGRRQECSFVFTDLAGSTALLETLDPEVAARLINGYLDGMIAIAFAHDGTLSRIVGDGLVIMFSAPVAQADHQRRALACGWAMREFSMRYAQEATERGIPFGQTRVGIHSGTVTVGNFGGSSIIDYRALGDPINTAARLESANRYLGTWICVSGDTLAGCPDWPVRPIGRVLLKGKTEPIAVYEVLDPAGPVPADGSSLDDSEVIVLDQK